MDFVPSLNVISKVTPLPLLNRFNPVHNFTACLFIIIIIIIITISLSSSPLHLVLTMLSMLQAFQRKPCTHLSSPVIHCHFRLTLLDFITPIICGKGYKLVKIFGTTFLYHPIISSILGPNIPLDFRFSNILSASHNVTLSTAEMTGVE